MGGGTLAFGLAGTGLTVLLLERGDFLPQERQNWDPVEVFGRGRYQNAEKWYAADGTAFVPGTYYYVGGNTKFYGGSLPRFRREDFDAVQHADGLSPAWPFGYDDLAPYYARAEQLYDVHGADNDPTLVREKDFPFPAVPHEPAIAALADRLTKNGLTPSTIPLGVDLRPDGTCIRCATCDGFPCRLLAKADAERNAVRPALRSPNVTLLTNTYVRRVLTDPSGAIVRGVEVETDGEVREFLAPTVAVSCGAVNSAALLLRSRSEQHPQGLANSSGLVGRRYMVHNNTVAMAIDPRRKNRTVFQKTLYVNDHYLPGSGGQRDALGHVQMIGKLQGSMLKAQRPRIPEWLLRLVAERSTDWWLFTEDLPDPENRVTLTDAGDIQVAYTPNNVAAHKKLVRKIRKALRRAGYPILVSQRAGIEVNSHQAGTVCAGTDPATSVLDPQCAAHDVGGLYVVDSAFFPSLPVMNPALTIAANALRVADHIAQQTPRDAAAQPQSSTQN
ncbi:MAG: GMC family oxidoreductase [Tetrasphaera sp.]